MTSSKGDPYELIRFLQEREKELACIYRVEEILNRPEVTPEEICRETAEAIPPAWQYPDVCEARVRINGIQWATPGFKETPWSLTAEILMQDRKSGDITVCYTKEMPTADQGPFLVEENKLLKTLADRIGHFMTYRTIKETASEYQAAREHLSGDSIPEWRVVLGLLRRTDKKLYLTICRKMLNYLSWSGVDEAEKLLDSSSLDRLSADDRFFGEENQPLEQDTRPLSDQTTERIMEIASTHLSNETIVSSIQKWMQEDNLSFLVHVVNRDSRLAELIDALHRYRHMIPDGLELPAATKKGIVVALIRRFLSEQLGYINTAKEYFDISDFHTILDRVIYSSRSHGKLGGKSAGLLLAEQIIRKVKDRVPELDRIKVPRSWYLASDMLLEFISYNNLGEVVEQKYKDIDQVRLEYPHVVRSFRSCRFPPETVQGLAMVLDEFEDRPLIVRSSSLLEDRMGAAFSGKYRSLFIANQGTKQERLEALTGAIAEVYASTFGPDPIEYRAERGLLDFAEEMGIIIQEVVGSRIGDYFIPSFAGVAFSRNEFRWSPRIKREDGLARLVPGLGTRAVDRIGDDYPILIAPGRPRLRVNVSVDEVVRYSPRRVDVINLRTRAFQTVEVTELLRAFGPEIPGIQRMISVLDGDQIRKPMGLNVDFSRDDLLVTFEGLVGNTDFVKRIGSLLKTLEGELNTPVDVEFADDGKDFYLLQCRPQSYAEAGGPAPIPKDIPERKTLFTARKYISNGRIRDITHLVYVDPEGYSDLGDRERMLAVGRAVGKLNKLLPKRQFVLMGPGRWGSRGDIKLGVSVTYSDINNTAALIEIARKKGDYTPDLSFGTHFFQDLVEAGIRYLPLYPDDPDVRFNERFLHTAENILGKVVPEFAGLEGVVKLIDIKKETGGEVLRILMNADLCEAIGLLAEPSEKLDAPVDAGTESDESDYNYWAWRLKMAERIASALEAKRFGVKALYVFGSTKNATAGPGSDIDLLVHFAGTPEQRRALELWFEGWSLSLAETNYLRTGYRTDGLLDVHFVTDSDIAKKTSYAVKIGAITDPARQLPTK
jgi:predicted nucleotidyltransferase